MLTSVAIKSMMLIIAILIVSNLLSLSAAIHIHLKLKKIKKRPDSLELREFLSQLLSGSAALRIKLIDEADYILRSRR